MDDITERMTVEKFIKMLQDVQDSSEHDVMKFKLRICMDSAQDADAVHVDERTKTVVIY